MTDWYNIKYREFYDIPRFVVASRGHKTYLFSCPFDDVIDEYPNFYRVYLMPELSDEMLSRSWEDIELLALKEIDTIFTHQLPFVIER